MKELLERILNPAPVLSFNALTGVISLSEVEQVLKIVFLLLSIALTIMSIIHIRSKIRKDRRNENPKSD